MSVRTFLDGWGNFYLITGTAAAALTGLQFVVQTLISSETRYAFAGEDAEGGIMAFGTPTVVHFSFVLLVAGVLSVPWPGVGGLRIVLGALGVGALVYAGVVFRRAVRQQAYVPVFEDWLWHIVFPVIAYTALLVSALVLGRVVEGPLLAVGGSTLLLLSVGIHNAWDSVVHLTLRVAQAAPGPAEALSTEDGVAP